MGIGGWFELTFRKQTQQRFETLHCLLCERLVKDTKLSFTDSPLLDIACSYM